MEANEAPENIYIPTIFAANTVRYKEEGAIEYVRKDAFIEKACHYLYNYNQKQILKHGARATLGCGEYTINVEDFRKYMEV